MSLHRVCILGGTGFVGRRISAHLAAAGHQVSVLTRRRERHRDLLVLPTVQVVEGDIYNPTFLRRQFQAHDVVINLVGILNEKGRDGKGFEHAHVTLSGLVVQACRHSGVRRLLHMSALHAAQNGPSHYLRTKGLAEKMMLEAHDNMLHITVFRPSVIFGAQDSFTNRFARLLRQTPLLFPLACPDARFQPVFVEDVAQAFVAAIDNHTTHGKSYDLCGPRVYTLREIVAYLAGQAGVRRCVIGLGQGLSWLQAVLLEFAPGKPFTRDNYRSLQVDSTCKAGFPAFAGIKPACLEDVVPGYLGRHRSDLYASLRQGSAR
jgi:NADH dehydrogenase